MSSVPLNASLQGQGNAGIPVGQGVLPSPPHLGKVQDPPSPMHRFLTPARSQISEKSREKNESEGENIRQQDDV